MSNCKQKTGKEQIRIYIFEYYVLCIKCACIHMPALTPIYTLLKHKYESMSLTDTQLNYAIFELHIVHCTSVEVF